jgi:hypothetical protein
VKTGEESKYCSFLAKKPVITGVPVRSSRFAPTSRTKNVRDMGNPLLAWLEQEFECELNQASVIYR